MDENGQDAQVNEKLQSFLEVNGQIENIVRKDLRIPYGKSSSRIGEVVSGFYCHYLELVLVPD